MKHLIILLIIINASLFGQNNWFFWDDTTNTTYGGELKVPQYAVPLNGTTQYLSKTSPTGLDLNGAEMIPKDSNTTFESLDTTDWTGYGTASCDTSSTRKYAGSYSLRDVTTGVGDSTTNYMSLAATNFTAIQSGKKYTAEYRVNAVGKAGTNIIPDSNSSFTTWGLTGYSVGNGTLTHNDSGWCVLNSTGIGYIQKGSVGTAGRVYEVSFAYKSAGYRGTISPYFGGAVSYAPSTNCTANWQYYKKTIPYNGSVTFSLILNTTYTGTVDFDSISVKLLTPPTYTIVIGDKSFTSDTISIIPGVFEKVVFNFQATASTVGQAIKIYCSQADTGYFDSFSLTQAKDLMVNVWIKTSGTAGIVCDYDSRVSTPIGYALYLASTTKARGFLNDGVTAPTVTTTEDVNTNAWKLVTFVYKRVVDSLLISVDGGAYTKAYQSLGKIKAALTYGFAIGARAGGGANFFTGSIGEVQITTFDNIASLTVTPATLYARGKNGLNFPSSNGGTIVGWWFKSKSFNDNSASANNLTGTSVNATDMIEVDY